jgi:hypothetical protein
MANYQTPVMLRTLRGGRVALGVCQAPVAPGPSGPSKLETALDALKAEVANAGAHLALDAETRKAYIRLTAEMSAELRQAAQSGRMTWEQAANEAQVVRNAIMEQMRARTTPVGRSLAEQMKAQGKSLNELIAEKTAKLFGKGRAFEDLSAAERDSVFAEIVASAGRGRPSVNASVRLMSRAGRGLLVFSLAVSVYTVATAQDKVDAARHEGAATLAGIGGGIAGGAAAGLVCGPGAPVCVTIGAFVGGAMAALGVDYFHLW